MDDLKNIIQIKRSDNNLIILLTPENKIQQASSLDLEIIFYPLNKDITSDDITFLPFSEYAKEVSQNTKTIYSKSIDDTSSMFGALLGIIVIIIFIFIKADDFLSIRSLVTAAGAFAFGKEMWSSIDKTLISITERWKLSFSENLYSFKLRKPTTITQYAYFAKKLRYGNLTLLPHKMDFIDQSNSKLLRMNFNNLDIKSIKENTQILIISLKEQLINSGNFLIAFKISFNYKFFGFTKSLEYFQALNNSTSGAIDDKGQWLNDSVFFRRNYSFSRWKYYSYNTIISNKKILSLT